MSKSITLLVFTLAISLTGFQLTHAQEQPSNSETYTEQMLGGWSPTSIDEQVMNAAYFAASAIHDGQLQNVLSARQQVVAGMNYAMVLEMDNGHQWETIVYQNLDNVYSLTSKKRLY
ncbi:cystatin domain-containing protein [Kistimonas asteriae]|uniref:cystatin domain-containing protein n=1 Tax=Kistimonas asteriae TaxID=517724 RepID=UPI001BA8A662|nr:cystatin domain-containing protein [Kistimonas asteriae]